MATHTESPRKHRRTPFRTGLHHLHVRRLGFDHVPAIPVDIPGMLDTVLRLGVRTKRYEQPLQGLSNTYTIGGSTARAYEFLYGDEGADAKRGAARERLHGFLRRNPHSIDDAMAAEKLAERHDDSAGNQLATLSLDDPTQ